MDRAGYEEFLDQVISGKIVTARALLDHFAYQDRDTRTGPAVGEPVPDVVLTSHTGDRRPILSCGGPAGQLLVFARSVDWCSYCRNQLVELVEAHRQIEEAGIGVAAITSDGVEVLAAFSEQADVPYTLFSDAGGEAAMAFGILNRNISNAHQGSSVAFPGQFLVGPDGMVRAKEFTGDLRYRASATVLVDDGVDDEAVVVTDGTAVARIELSTHRVFGGQEIGVAITIEVPPDRHVYAADAPPPYRALSVRIDDELIEHQPVFDHPTPEWLEFEASGERLPIHHGPIRLTGRLRFRWRPILRRVRGVDMPAIPVGDRSVTGAIAYQVCSDVDCQPPAELPFDVPVTILDDSNRPALNGRE